MPSQGNLPVGASGCLGGIRNEYFHQRLPEAETDHPKDENKSYDHKKSRSALLFIPLSKTEAFLRRGILFCVFALLDVPLYLEHRYYREHYEDG